MMAFDSHISVKIVLVSIYNMFGDDHCLIKHDKSEWRQDWG